MVVSLLTKTRTTGQHPNDVGAYLLAVGMSAPYAIHRRAPFMSTVIVLGCVLTYAAIGFAAFPGVSAFVLLYGVALHHERSRSVPAFVATAATLVAAILLQPSGVVDRASGVSIALATVVACSAGEPSERRARWGELRERNALLEREREERARQAVVEERLRIARELHDVVAHAMSVIAVQSGVGSPSVARIRSKHSEPSPRSTTSRSALVEMRRLLGVLRQEGDGPAATTPAPSLRGVPALIRQVADGGLTAGLHIDGAPVDVPPGLDLSAYRISRKPSRTRSSTAPRTPR